jgi:5'-3' exonuclease
MIIILLDFHGTMISSIMKYLFLNETDIIDESLCRHMILNSVRAVKVTYGTEYGRMVISCDGKDYWRKELFPYYKIKRKKAMGESLIDWGQLHSYMDKIKKEIEENFRYAVIQVDRAESDDIIGVLARTFHESENILIASRDHDFEQLQNLSNVKQYNPIDKKMVVVANPVKNLFEHIVKGDTGDSIPNIFSDKNSFAINTRQKPAFQKKIDLWYEAGEVPEEHKERFEFNKQLIDLSFTPKDLQKEILEKYNSQLTKPNKNLTNYFMKYGLREMLTNIQDF